ncbi:DNA pilot protein [Dipodfec virus RodF1_35]|uniref:DNA pilot protein n=1 Tax=Dipodfec virus RodF1_35 TaxID=2929295 RepID=A0A976N357_9VIRU|nr:DNA pilot protein [Dipodfec virus RodF1_35]
MSALDYLYAGAQAINSAAPAVSQLAAAASGARSAAGAKEVQWENFQQNKELMRLQQQYYQSSVDAANKYNSPSAVASRLRAAGFSPSLAISSGVGGISGSTVPSSSPVSNPGSPAFLPAAAGLPQTSLSDISVNAAQASALNSSARESQTRSDLNTVDLQTRSLINNNVVRIGNTQIEFDQSRIRYTDAQRDAIRNYVANLDASTTELYGRYMNSLADLNLKAEEYRSRVIDNFFKPRHHESSLANDVVSRELSRSNISLNSTQRNLLIEQIATEAQLRIYRMLDLTSTADYKDAQARAAAAQESMYRAFGFSASTQGDLNVLHYNFDKTYMPLERALQAGEVFSRIVNNSVDSFCKVVGTAKGILGSDVIPFH